MSKSKLVREIRIYLYADGNHEVRILEARVVPKRDAAGRFVAKARPHQRAEVSPDTLVACPVCGCEFRVHRRQG